MAQVRFGNAAPVSVTRKDDDELVRTAIDHSDPVAGESITEMQTPDDASLSEAFTDITAATGAWSWHSDEPPTWVSSDDPDLAKLLAAHYKCEVRKHDTKVVTVFGDRGVARPAAHRPALAAHAARLGVKDGAVADAADAEAEA